ncbi:type VI secretion system membrane subunit TssM [Zavarzinia sp.]|uniref:type VI secretion system membrane subunit TssM n=1 Tax=Zavarzinia sp. TaxID=2027920 RepID=UPI0035675239
MSGMLLRFAVGTVGLVAFAALVWLAGPLLGFGNFFPLASEWVRSAVILVAVVGAAAVAGVLLRRRRRAVANLEKAMVADDAGSDAGPLRERMQEALRVLKHSGGGKGGFLYDLPWYVIIGPPGSGKTTALVNSGLSFDLRDGTAGRGVSGSGGTQYCEWFFAKEAVFIDTAGRYTTQGESDTKGSKESWLEFLDILKRNRARQPINGVIVAISIEAFLADDEAAVAAHVQAVRRRIAELSDKFRIDLPVYVMFSKMDLVAGFTAFFDDLKEDGRRSVWGTTFPADSTQAARAAEAPKCFDALIERLSAMVPDRLERETVAVTRAEILAFPTQMKTLESAVCGFLDKVFDETPYQRGATLRGFYFTSGTQEGSPIDRLIGAQAEAFGRRPPSIAGGRGKSFFLTDLVRRVIIGEAGWVSSDPAEVRRENLLRAAVFAGTAVLCLAMAVAWFVSFGVNAELAALAADSPRTILAAQPALLPETLVDDVDFESTLPTLDVLRDLPAGYGRRSEAGSIWAGFGLGQRARIGSQAESTYRTGLDRLLRTRMLLRLEQVLADGLTRRDVTSLYEAVKVYLLVAGGVRDPGPALAWFDRDFAANLYPGSANQAIRQRLRGHMEALFAIDDGRPVMAPTNQPLLFAAQSALAQISLADRAFETLRSRALAAGAGREWRATTAGGNDLALVFTAEGGDLDAVTVPFFFTYRGFQESLVPGVRGIGDELRRDAWVLGTPGESAAVTQQYGRLATDLMRRYGTEFRAAWTQALGRLRIKPLGGEGVAARQSLAAAAAPTSPIVQIIQSVRDESALTGPADGASGDTPSGAAAGTVASAQAPGQEIENAFRDYRNALTGAPGQRLVDQVTAALDAVGHSLAEFGTGSAAVRARAEAELPGQIEVLKAKASLLPEPFASLVRTAAMGIEQNYSGLSAQQVAGAVKAEVAGECAKIVSGRYPFVKASQVDVPLADFGRLFGAGGVFDSFFRERLKDEVDTSVTPWRFRADSRLAQSLSPDLLTPFRLAADIRDTFFDGGRSRPAATFTIRAMVAGGSGSLELVSLETGAAVVAARPGNAPAQVEWPAPTGFERTAVTLVNSATPGEPPLRGRETSGPWSLMRFAEASGMRASGETVSFTAGVGGVSATYIVTSNALHNPLSLPALRNFRCPQ